MKLLLLFLALVLSEEVPQVLPTEGLQCTICKFVMSEVEKFIKEGKTEAEIEKFLEEKVCGLLPKVFSDTCDAFVEEYLPQIIELLLAQVPPEKVCTVLGLCKTNGDIKCEACQVIIKELNKLVGRHVTEAKVKKCLDQVCEKMPGLIKEICEDLVDDYAGQLVQCLMKHLTVDMTCNKLKFCHTHRPHPKPHVQAHVQMDSLQFDIKCEACKFVMSEAQKIVGGQPTVEKAKAALKVVCHKLPSWLEDVCDDLVEEYTPQLIDALVRKLSPDTACASIGMCPKRLQAVAEPNDLKCSICTWVMGELESLIEENATVAEIEKALEGICNLLPKAVRSACDAFVEEYTPMIVELIVHEVDPDKICKVIGLCPKKVTAEENSIQCAVCEWVITELDKLIEENATEAEIEKALEHVCNLLPKSVRAVCDSLVEEYTPMIIELLVHEVDPEKVCTVIGLCSARKENDANDIKCSVCQWVLSELEKIIGEKPTEEKIEKALEKVCDLLPATLRSTCTAFVDQYTPMIIELLVHEIAPEKVCALIGLCKKRSENDIQCAVCQWVLAELEKIIGEKPTEEKIEKALEKVCGLLPASLKDTCDAFVEQYTPMLIELLIHEIDPAKACQILGICAKH